MVEGPRRFEVTYRNTEDESFVVHVFPPPAAPATVEAAQGSSQPVLFCVHGAGMSGDNFALLARELQGGATVLEVDMPPMPDDGNASSPFSTSSRVKSTMSGDSNRAVAVARPPLPSAVPPRLRPAAQVSRVTTSVAGHAASAVTTAPENALACPPPEPARVEEKNRDYSSVGGGVEEQVSMYVVAYDLRCHGKSTFAGGEENLTIAVLLQDFCDILAYVKDVLFPQGHFFVLGHSLGGAIVARALSEHKELHDRVGGVILLDVVEGTAKASLQYMHDFLKKRPHDFNDVAAAKTWFLRHGGMHSIQGVASSVPPLLRHDAGTGRWVWRSDLDKMDTVWDGWFDGMDKAFVQLPFPKMLCLANMERLDTELIVAQMQGKFQFEVIGNNCGHYVMDEVPELLASKVRRFVRRIEGLSQALKNGRFVSHVAR